MAGFDLSEDQEYAARMTLSNGAGATIAALVLAGVMTLPAPCGNAQEPAGGHPTSSAKKASIEYRNAQYGFCFSLPASWRGYSIVADRWTGEPLNPRAGKATQYGPRISIRHPLWTKADPRQDIPIMVFTTRQWRLIENEDLSVGAAPFPPSELGRNSKYVFALPARYNFAFPTGFEEVQEILGSHPLRGDCPPPGDNH